MSLIFQETLRFIFKEATVKINTRFPGTSKGKRHVNGNTLRPYGREDPLNEKLNHMCPEAICNDGW